MYLNTTSNFCLCQCCVQTFLWQDFFITNFNFLVISFKRGFTMSRRKCVQQERQKVLQRMHRCKIRKTTLSHWVFFVKFDSSFLIFNTSNSFYFKSNVSESNSHWSPKNHDVLQERVDAEESAKHQETHVDITKESSNTIFVEKETNIISGKLLWVLKVCKRLPAKIS